MIRYLAVAALCALAVSAVHAQVAAPTPEPLYRLDFNGANGGLTPEMRALPGVGIEAGKDGSPALTVESKTPGLTHVRIPLPVEKLRGKRVTFTAMVRAENVAVAPQSYNGIKVMLHTDGPSGKQWEQQNRVWGDFDWKPITHTFRVYDDAREAYLILGLENTTGKAWFDDVRITETPLRPRPATRPSGPVFKGHNLPRLRGAQVNIHLTEEDYRHLGKDWNANVLRWQLGWSGTPKDPANRATVAEYDAWLKSALDEMDRMLPVCEKAGMLVVIDIHSPPGGRDEKNVCRLFQDKAVQEYFPRMWETIARRYKGRKVVWGYDLINEPVEGVIPAGLKNWNQIALETAKRVAAIDPDHAIIVEPAEWGLVSSIENLEYIPLRNVVYSVHMYEPHAFTHQGVGENKVGLTYPGMIDGVMWDKARLRRLMQRVRDFQTDYGVHIYMGEFSAIRWAPGDSAYNYLKDVIDIAEEFGWDWTYHAYREWNGWSVEHGPDPKDNNPAATPTDRQKLMTDWFAKNKKPKF